MVVRRTCNAKVCGSIPHVGKKKNVCRDSIAVSIPACHAGDPGSIPGRGVFFIVAFGALARGVNKTAPTRARTADLQLIRLTR